MVRYAFSTVGMTSIFTEAGVAQGVTVLKMLPAKILRHERSETGKVVVVVEYDTGKNNKLTRGWVVENPAEYEVGSSLKTPALTQGQKLKITGLSKGRGFQDVMTIYHFGGGPASHGSRFHRNPGSIGMRTEPGRVTPGKKMPRRDGNEQITLRNVKLAYWSEEETIAAIVGGVPGARGCTVFL